MTVHNGTFQAMSIEPCWAQISRDSDTYSATGACPMPLLLIDECMGYTNFNSEIQELIGVLLDFPVPNLVIIWIECMNEV